MSGPKREAHPRHLLEKQFEQARKERIVEALAA